MIEPTSSTKKRQAMRAVISAEPDLVDRIFDYLVSEMPHLAADVKKYKDAVRSEFVGERCYIAATPATLRQQQAAMVLSLFNGRNASEVARRLNISRATVYRIIKQPGVNKKFSALLEMEQVNG